MKKRRKERGWFGFLMALMVIIGAFTMPAFAGSLEPPASAVDASGNPVPTTPMPPTWSQTLPASERFELVMGGAAVLDKETGLVWEQSPSTTIHSWYAASLTCYTKGVGSRMGWRLPTVEELSSLVDPWVRYPGPALPSGHLFTSVQSSPYWSATTFAGNTTSAWIVNFGIGGANVAKDSYNYVWCVRGGQGYDGW